MKIQGPPEVEGDEGPFGDWGRTIVLSHGSRAKNVVLLLHGLSASPKQFIEFADRLHARGSNVLVPRLPRHGYEDRMTRALANLDAEELEAFTHDAVAQARELGDRIVVAGFSLGGLLACRIAQREAIARAVAIAPFLGISFVPELADRLILRGTLRVPNRYLWWHPLLRERLGPPHGYPRYATHALGQAHRLSERLFREAASAPPRAESIALVSNASETAVSNSAIARLRRTWNRHSGVSVEDHRLTGLPPSHDIIEPLGSRRLSERVYPRLLDLVDR